jgi:hypothetical protein
MATCFWDVVVISEKKYTLTTVLGTFYKLILHVPGEERKRDSFYTVAQSDNIMYATKLHKHYLDQLKIHGANLSSWSHDLAYYEQKSTHIKYRNGIHLFVTTGPSADAQYRYDTRLMIVAGSKVISLLLYYVNYYNRLELEKIHTHFCQQVEWHGLNLAKYEFELSRKTPILPPVILEI